MARIFLTALNLNQNELQNARVQNLSTAPATPVTGQLYYDTDDNKLYWWNGSAWIDATGGAGGISATIVDVKGDLIVATAADTVGRLAAGANDEILMADSSTGTGLKWVASGTPSTQAFGDSAVVGTADTFTRGDHKHAMPANPVTAHEAASDPHTGYVLESLFDAKGDIIAASADNTPAKLTVGADDTILMADAAAGAGLKWVAAGTPSTQAFGDSAVVGTADTFTRGDHKHAMPSHGLTQHQELIATSDLTDWPRAAALDLNSQKITGLANGTAATDAVNLGQLNSLSSGIDWKESVRAATTAAGTLATSFENGDSVGGVTLVTGNRILIKDQATASENGIYTVNASGAPTRATDADASAEVTGGMAVWVNEGTNADTGWVLTTDDPITLGTTNLTFTQFSGLGQITAGAALTKTGNTLDVAVDGTTIEVSSDALRVAATAAGAGLNGGGGSALAVNPGTGITTTGDAVNIDTTVVARRFAADCAAATSTVVTHNLGTRSVLVGVRRKSTPWDEVDCDTEATTTNSVTVRFTTAPAAGDYEITIIG